jgi:hypothetical protein
MKTFTDYINKVFGTQEDQDMKPRKIMAEQTNEDVVFWNTEDDRWSRKAKHPLRINEIPTEPLVSWEKGEMAIYESQAVEISIPKGPNSTVGIIVEGKTKMVLGSKLEKLTEGVLGGMQPLNPINRMMQLAGIAVPQILGDNHDLPTNTETVEQVINEDTGNMFDALFRSNLAGEYKNNPDAARLATIGQIMVGLNSQIQELKGKLSPDLEGKISTVAGLGALLMQSAKAMTQA